MKAVIAAFNQEKALVGAFSVITNLRMELFEALFPSCVSAAAAEIIRLCCRLAAHQRPALHHLKHFMWFSELDWAALADRSLSPPQVPKIENCSDHSNFDTYPVDLETPNDDYSDWSKDF